MGKGRQGASGGTPLPVPASQQRIASNPAPLTPKERAEIEADAEQAQRQRSHYAQLLRDYGYADLRQLHVDLIGSLGLEDPTGDEGLQKYAEEAQDRLGQWSRAVASIEEAVSQLGKSHRAVPLSTSDGEAIASKTGETLGQMLTRYQGIRDRAAADLRAAWDQIFHHIGILDSVEEKLDDIFALTQPIYKSPAITSASLLPFDNEDPILNSSTRISWWGRIGPWILNRDYELYTKGGKYSKQVNRIIEIRKLIIREFEIAKSSLSKSNLNKTKPSSVGLYLANEFAYLKDIRSATKGIGSKTMHALRSKKTLKSLAARGELVAWNV